MAPIKFLNLLAISALAILATSFNAVPVNALSVEHRHAARSVNHAHAGIAKKKRDGSTRRCKPRTSTSIASVATSTTHTSVPSTHISSSHVSSSSAAPPPPPPKSSSSSHTTESAAPSSSAEHTTASPHPSSSSSHSTSSNKPTATPVIPPPPSSGGGGGKVGLTWSNNEESSLPNFKTKDVAYVYNWDATKVAGAAALGIEPIPMLWGAKDLDAFKSTVVAGYATRVFGFNEPDQNGESNLDPTYAAQLWMEYLQPLKNAGYELISPACTNAPAGFTWQQNFFSACKEKGCTIDALAIHHYSVVAQALIDQLNQYHNAFGLDIWVTEFAAQDFSGKNQQLSASEISSFLAETTNFMQSQPWVRAYFWFSAMQDWELEQNNVNGLNALMGGDNKPNALGEQYLNP
ncbi:glycosyl hydrolase catalytic core-domain-containing protein [Gloeopeniophorella convolvens]|nr:glycosyl hydrolase catalytic core-domain-containing protein [Gloeopeniophorella convolvens]